MKLFGLSFLLLGYLRHGSAKDTQHDVGSSCLPLDRVFRQTFYLFNPQTTIFRLNRVRITVRRYGKASGWLMYLSRPFPARTDWISSSGHNSRISVRTSLFAVGQTVVSTLGLQFLLCHLFVFSTRVLLLLHFPLVSPFSFLWGFLP